jgi:signal transduction histidine kinase
MPTRFPVTVLREPELAAKVLTGIARDATISRRFAIFEIQVDRTEYQVVAILRYSGQFRDHLEDAFGFMVNMEWARQNYFPELTNQVARMGGRASGLALAVVDEHGERVVSTHPGVSNGPVSRRSFPVIFFDPLLAAVAQSKGVSSAEWVVEVRGAPDPTLGAAFRGANRTLLLAALAAISLAFGLVMTARAVSANDRLNELRAEFVSTVTHELKTPISTIRAVGDTLASGRISTRGGQIEYAQIVIQEAKRLTRLVDNLLALSRITDVTEVYWFEPLAIESLVEKTLGDFEPQMAAAGVETQVEIPADLPLIRGDRTAIGLMLDNIIDNAIRYSPARRSLLITAAQADGAIVLNVTDAGQGIPEDQLAHVTRKFFRGRNPVSNGSGLGLAIVKRIAGDHGGHLRIESTLNVGTTVSVSFPMVRSDEETDSGH